MEDKLKAASLDSEDILDRYSRLKVADAQERINSEHVTMIEDENEYLRNQIEELESVLKATKEDTKKTFEAKEKLVTLLVEEINSVQRELQTIEFNKATQLAELVKTLEAKLMEEMEAFKKDNQKKILNSSVRQNMEHLQTSTHQLNEASKQADIELEELRSQHRHEIKERQAQHNLELEELKIFCETHLADILSQHQVELQKRKAKMDRMKSNRRKEIERLTMALESEKHKMQKEHDFEIRNRRLEYQSQLQALKERADIIRKEELRLQAELDKASKEEFVKSQHETEVKLQEVKNHYTAKKEETVQLISSLEQEKIELVVQLQQEREQWTKAKKELEQAIKEAQRITEIESSKKKHLRKTEARLLEELDTVKTQYAIQRKVRGTLEEQTGSLKKGVMELNEVLPRQLEEEKSRLETMLKQRVKRAEQDKQKRIETKLHEERAKMSLQIPSPDRRMARSVSFVT